MSGSRSTRPVRQGTTHDTNDYGGLAGPTTDGRTIMLVQFDDRARLWRAEAGKKNATALTDEAERNVPVFFAPVANGDIVFEASPAGNVDLWVLRPDGKQERLTNDAAREYIGDATPDGTIAYFIDQGGISELWTMGVDGSNRRRIGEVARWVGTSISSDGSWAAVGTHTGLLRFELETGASRQLHPAHALEPDISPDGSKIAVFLAVGKGSNPFRIAILPSGGGAPLQIFDLPLSARTKVLRWTPDGSGLVYVGSAGEIENLWMYPLAGGSPTQLTFFEDGAVESVNYTADRRALLMSRKTLISDAVLVHYEEEGSKR